MSAQEIVEKARSAAIATDRQGRILGWNSNARKMLGYDEESSPAGQSLAGFLAATDIFGNRLAERSLNLSDLLSDDSVSSFEFKALTGAGESVRLAATLVVVVSPDSEDFEVVYLLRPILRRRKADEAIERILASPSLTRIGEIGRSLRGDDRADLRLTPRQVEVLRLLAEGSTAEGIADRLGVSIHTVRSHIQNIFLKMGVHSQIEAVAKALRSRLV